MKYLEVDEFGKYLVLRRQNLSKEEFFSAIKCKPTVSISLQNNIYNMLCVYGASVDELYKSYLVSYPGSNMSFADFVAWHYSLDLELVNGFLEGRHEGELCYYVNNTLINGYNEISLLNEDRELDEPVIAFQKALKETIRDL